MEQEAPFHSENNRDRSGRIVPRWAADLVARLAQEAPTIVTRERLEKLLVDSGSSVPVDVALKRLLRLRWLRGVSVRGAFAFVPPGVDDIADRYIDLRGWHAKNPSAIFYLASDNAAWHLGYLDREPEGVTVWLPPNTTLPSGLRGKISNVKTRFPTDKIDARHVGPTADLLRKRRLDLLTWSAGLPAFGPEALIAQIASRPASFKSWVDLANKIGDLARDADIERLRVLLSASSASAQQRAAYLLRLGKRDDAATLLPAKIQPVEFGTGDTTSWDAITGVNDHLVARLMSANAKA
ncbi:MAG: hypothetical protein IT381_05955 [Deltaproteobacteria bacterium]|nr:hypothetical protein [Deltaproteobacteria bacterium]